MFAWLSSSQAVEQDNDGSAAVSQGGLITGDKVGASGGGGVAGGLTAPTTTELHPTTRGASSPRQVVSPPDTLFAGMELTRPRRRSRLRDCSVTASSSSQSGVPSANVARLQRGATSAYDATSMQAPTQQAGPIADTAKVSETDRGGVSAFAFLIPQVMNDEDAAPVVSNGAAKREELGAQEGTSGTRVVTTATSGASEATSSAPPCMGECEEGDTPHEVAIPAALEGCGSDAAWRNVCEAERRLRELAANGVCIIDRRSLHGRRVRLLQAEMREHAAVEAYAEADRCRAEVEQCVTSITELEANLDGILDKLHLTQIALRDNLRHLDLDIQGALSRVLTKRLAAQRASVAAAEREQRVAIELDETAVWEALQRRAADTIAQCVGTSGPAVDYRETLSEHAMIAAELRVIVREKADLDATIAMFEIQLAELRERRAAYCSAEEHLHAILQAMQQRCDTENVARVTGQQQPVHNTALSVHRCSSHCGMQQATPATEGVHPPQEEEEGHMPLEPEGRTDIDLLHLITSIAAALRVTTSADASDEGATRVYGSWEAVVFLLSERCHGRWWLFAEGGEELSRSFSPSLPGVRAARGDNGAESVEDEETHDVADKDAVAWQGVGETDAAPPSDEETTITATAVALQRERQLDARVSCLRHRQTLSVERVRDLAVRLKGLQDALRAVEQAKLTAVETSQFQAAQARVNEARELSAAVEQCIDEHEFEEVKVRRYDTVLRRTREQLATARARTATMRQQCIARYEAALAAALRHIDKSRNDIPLVAGDAVTQGSAADIDDMKACCTENAEVLRYTSPDGVRAPPHDECETGKPFFFVFDLDEHRAAMRELLLAMHREAKEAIDTIISTAGSQTTTCIGCQENNNTTTNSTSNPSQDE